MSHIRRAAEEAIVIVGNIYHPQAEYPPMLDAALNYVNTFIGETVRDCGFRLADIYTAFRGNEDEYLCQGIEPTLAGAAAITDLFEHAFYGE